MLLQRHFLTLPKRCQLFHFKQTDNVDTTNRPTLGQQLNNAFVFTGADSR